ncbi:ABC transporter permease [Geomesophilobacter sediminis]|uniref:ABC transporter permease n=1 Tax=Geomesophilobacter sediminis TaxID=2798584 RepID=A0A8J7JIN5_9BACT|nr:ABC transporter permease [Geomesophilobacter sediminis]MBJ6724320.1 ABC transporter permease [Geomesophilobacter sediminis]
MATIRNQFFARHLDKLSILLFFVVWQLLPKLGGIVETFITPPTVVFATLVDLFREGDLLSHVGVSLYRSAAGFAGAAAVAIPLGFLLGGNFRTFQRLVGPVLRFLGQVNPFSLFPLFILLFGIGEFSKVAMIFWVCIWPILFNTINAVKGIDPLLVKSARSLGTGVVTLFFKVILPDASPGIFHGLKMGCSTAFFMLIAAEMIGASAGLGWMVWNAQINFQMPQLFAATVLISTLGLTLNFSLGLLESRLVGWKQKSFSGNN